MQILLDNKLLNDQESLWRFCFIASNRDRTFSKLMVDGASVLTGWPKVDTFVIEEERDLEAALHLQLKVVLCNKWDKITKV